VLCRNRASALAHRASDPTLQGRIHEALVKLQSQQAAELEAGT
jgi:hypothetical protein